LLQCGGCARKPKKLFNPEKAFFTNHPDFYAKEQVEKYGSINRNVKWNGMESEASVTRARTTKTVIDRDGKGEW
jgi:hypothetical protein